VTAVADPVRSRSWLIIAVVSVARSWRVSSKYVGGVLPAMLLRVGLGFVVAVAINAGTGEIRPTRRLNRSRARQYQPADVKPRGVRPAVDIACRTTLRRASRAIARLPIPPIGPPES
jgi:hypothetical protein